MPSTVFPIRRSPTDTAGVAYDQTERIFAVTVTDKDMDGALEVDEVYNVMGTTVEQNYSIFSVTADPFTNHYSVSHGTVATIHMAKTMDRQNGLDHALDGFVFRLTDVSGNTFVYTLKEIDPQITGMTYDRTEYTVTVQKTMSQNGLTYKLDGFAFRLKGEGVEETLISDTDGKALYTLTLDKDDIGKTLTYTLTEVNTGIADMTYDTKTVTVSIDVTLENGELVAAVKQDEKAVTEITAEFVNTYSKQEPIPSTGDLNLPLYLTLLIASAGLAISLIYRRKITE